MIDLRNTRIDHHLGVFGDGHRAIEHLGDKLLHQVLALLPGLAKPALIDYLGE